MKMATDCLQILINTLLDNCDLANAPVNILIGNKLHDVKEFYYDDDIAEYIMVLTEGYEYEKR